MLRSTNDTVSATTCQSLVWENEAISILNAPKAKAIAGYHSPIV